MILSCNANAQELWSEIRKSFRLKDYSYIPQVREQINWIKLHPTYLNNFAENSSRYIYYILEEIKQKDLPGELVLMPMIESNYNPFAYSHAGAAGLWQLMPGTGSGLGIQQDWWYEGRRDIKPSTNAALTYLQYLAKFFDKQWLLAIAAYDSGEGTVLNAVRKNQQHRQKTDFWNLPLPRETQAYLPRLLALASVIRSPGYYHISLPRQQYQPYFEEVTIREQLDLNQAAKIANISYAELLKLNPGHNRWTTSPNKDSSLLLPIASIEPFKQKLSTLSKQERLAWNRHVIAEGETLSGIAHSNKSSVSVIKNINKLKNDVIKPGQALYVPSTKIMTDKTATRLRRQISSINQGKSSKGPHKVVHIVKKGETFSHLEQKYQVKAPAIRFWNQITNATRITPGQKLILWVDKPSSVRKGYAVKAGDTLSAIAQKNHLTLSSLRQLNPQIKNLNQLKINQLLTV
jgi:membrane-bound lytic murein transglycosylase D